MTVVRDFTALLSGTSLHGTTGQGAFYTFSFSQVVPEYYYELYSEEVLSTFRPLTIHEMAKAKHAFIKWEFSSGLEFFQVPAGQGDIQLSVFDLDLFGPDSAGFAYYPGGLEDEHPINSDIFLDYDAAEDPYVLLHEIGHAIGLKHPFEGDLVLATDLDNLASTVMSYNVEGYFDGPLGTLDQQAAKFLYGDERTQWKQISAWGWDQQPATLRQNGTDAGNLLTGVSVIRFAVLDTQPLTMAADDFLVI